MKAIILAAGQSKRLRPITNNLPKCLLKFGKRTIIDYQIDALQNNNINEIIIVIGFQAKLLKNHLVKHNPDINLKFIENKQYKDTYPAHGLWLTKNYMNDDIIYLNADLLCDPKIIKNIIESRKKSITAIQKVEWDEEEVNVIVEKNLKVIEMGKHIAKKLNCGEFIGVTKMSKKFNQTLIKVLDDFIDKKEYKKFAADAINLTIQRNGEMYALDVSNFQAIEIDTLEDYKKAQKIWKAYEKNN